MSWKESAFPLEEVEKDIIKEDWKRRAVKIQPGKKEKSWLDLAIPVPVPKESISLIESLTRGGIQGATFGFADEIEAALRAPLSQKTYEEIRDEARKKYKLAEEARPLASAIGEITGGIAPAVAATLFTGGTALAPAAARVSAAYAPKTLGGLATAAGVYGAGKSEADLIKGEIGETAGDIALSAGLGYGVGKGLQTLGKLKDTEIIRKLKETATEGIKKAGLEGVSTALSTMLGPHREAIKARFLRQKEIAGAKPYDEIALNLREQLVKLKNELHKMNSEALESLTDKPVISVNDVLKQIESIKSKHYITDGISISKADRRAINILDFYSKKLEEIAKTKAEPLETVQMSGKEVKNLLKQIDSDTDWDSQLPDAVTNSLKQLRHFIDDQLKTKFDDYKRKMVNVQKATQLLDDIKKSFGFIHKPNEGLLPTDKTTQKIKTIVDEKNLASRRKLKEFGEFMREKVDIDAEDIIKEAENYRIAEQFKKEHIRGTRRVAMYGGLGAGMGYTLGGELGAGLGGAMGAGLGSVIGGTLDIKGGEYAAKIIDWMVRNNPYKLLEIISNNPKLFGDYRNILERAIKRGVSSFISTHFVLQQKDPEYRKELRKIEEELLNENRLAPQSR